MNPSLAVAQPRPPEVRRSDLDCMVLQVTELQPLVALPPWLLRWRVVSPMKYHVAGTIAAAGLAMQHGWAINLGGRFWGNHQGWRYCSGYRQQTTVSFSLQRKAPDQMGETVILSSSRLLFCFHTFPFKHCTVQRRFVHGIAKSSTRVLPLSLCLSESVGCRTKPPPQAGTVTCVLVVDGM